MNLSWIQLRDRVTRKQVDASLRKHVAERFGDCVTVTNTHPACWDVIAPGVGSVTVRLESPTRIEFLPSGESWSNYIEWFTRTHIGAEFRGSCGSEEDPSATWTPNPTKFPTLTSYLRAMRRGKDLDPAELSYINSLPAPMR